MCGGEGQGGGGGEEGGGDGYDFKEPISGL